MTTNIKLTTFELETSIEQIIALETFIQLDPKVNIISSQLLNSKWTYIVGIYNDSYNTNVMNDTFRGYLNSLQIKYREYLSLGIYGFTNKGLQYNLELLLQKYLELFHYNNIKVFSYNTIYKTPLYEKNTTIIGIKDVISLDTFANPAYDIMLIFHLNDICKSEKILSQTSPIGN